MLKVLAVASYTYSWMLFFLIAIPLGVAWFVLRRDLKAQKSSNPSIISA
jgi:cbb3-type cytochrome oxidase subunit 3